MSWLENLKPGDRVIKQRYDLERAMGVLRTTATQIILNDGGRYRKKDGHLIGYTGIYSNRIMEYTDSRASAIARKAKRDKMLSFLHEVYWHMLNNETLESVCKLLDKGGV